MNITVAMIMTKDSTLPRKAVVAGAILGATLLGLTIAGPAEAASALRVGLNNRTLTIDGDAAANTVAVGRTPAGVLTLGAAPLVINGRKVTTSMVDRIVVRGRAGDDTIAFDEANGPLPASRVQGGAGQDTVRLNGSTADDRVTVSANGTRVGLVARTSLDINGVERAEIRPMGGADSVAIGDLSGTELVTVDLDLAADGLTDTCTVDGTALDDAVTLTASPGAGPSVLGLHTAVTLVRTDPQDRLAINALAGDDVVDASSLAAGVVTLAIDGGDDDDVLIGSGGADTIRGGNGDDVLIGGPGADVLDGGPGSNVVIQD